MKTKSSIAVACFAALTLTASPPPTEGYVAHEWGTFTSVQGADGVQLEWHPLATSDLPGFVYGARRPGTSRDLALDAADKARLVARQRMETPVIYFYSPTPRDLDVAVNFPEGTITEWYPYATRAAWPPATTSSAASAPSAPGTELRWKRVQVLAPDSAAGVRFPHDGSGNHYYAARATEANPVRTAAAEGASETEKFLFYRGVGGFEAPLKVTLTDGPKLTVQLANPGTEPLRSLLVYQVQDGQPAWSAAGDLAPGATRTLHLSAPTPAVRADTVRAEATDYLRRGLVAEGLYPAEAEAMIRTWDDSWFSESGVRVFYLLPRTWTDRILPLRLDPAPRELVRVMVGRAELITPKAEGQLSSAIARFGEGDAAAQREAVELARRIGLGRFAEAGVRRLAARHPGDEAFHRRAGELLQRLAPAPVDNAETLANR